MEESVLYIVLFLLCVVIYLLLNQEKNKDKDKDSSNQELEILKQSLTNSINTMSTSFNSLSNVKDPEQIEKAIKEDVDKIKVLNK